MRVREVILFRVGVHRSTIEQQAVRAAGQRLVLDVDLLSRTVVDAAIGDPRRTHIACIASNDLDHVRKSRSSEFLRKPGSRRNRVYVGTEEETRCNRVATREQRSNLILPV